MQIFGSQIGMSWAMLRFSNLACRGERAVDRQRADRQHVALVGDHQRRDVLDERGHLAARPAGSAELAGDLLRILHFVQAGHAASTAAKFFCDDRFAASCRRSS